METMAVGQYSTSCGDCGKQLFYFVGDDSEYQSAREDALSQHRQVCTVAVLFEIRDMLKQLLEKLG